jgi:hypothetical protein
VVEAMILAIDPGYEQSAFVIFDGHYVFDHGIEANHEIQQRLQLRARPTGFPGLLSAIVFEQIESFGMAVGREVFETVFWTGRLYAIAADRYGAIVQRMPRRTVKVHLCQSARAQDTNIRTALLDRFGGSAAVGKKKSPGPLFGIKSHEWSALAIAVTWWDQQETREAASS